MEFFQNFLLVLAIFLYCIGIAVIPFSIVLFAKWANRKKKNMPVSKRIKGGAITTAVLAVVLYIIPGIVLFCVANFRKYTVGPEFNLMQTRIETTAGFYDFTYKNEYYNQVHEWMAEYELRQEPTVILIDPSDEYLECFEYKCGNGTVLLLSTDGNRVFAPYSKIDDLNSYYEKDAELTFDIDVSWKEENAKPLNMDRGIYKVLMTEDEYGKEVFPKEGTQSYFIFADSADDIYHTLVKIHVYGDKVMINGYDDEDGDIKGEVIPAEYAEKLLEALKNARL